MDQEQVLLEKCLMETEKYSAKFTDVRVFSRLTESLGMRNGQVEVAKTSQERGMNVRVILNDAWGYASSSRVSKSEIGVMVKNAIDIARKKYSNIEDVDVSEISTREYHRC